MNVGVNYLREHVPDHVRMHYSYDSAGEKPNIVPDFAQLSYFICARIGSLWMTFPPAWIRLPRARLS